MAACTNPSCGAEIDASDAFCGYCGSAQATTAESAPGAGNAGTLVAQAPAPAAPAADWTAPPSAPAGPTWTVPPPGGPVGAGAPAAGQIPADAGTYSDLLLGEAAPNSVYLGNRMMYEKARDLENFDPIENARYWRAFWMHYALTGLIWAVGLIPILIATGLASLVMGAAGVIIGLLFLIAWCLLMAGVFWLRPLPAQLSEWKFEVDAKGAAAPISFSHIAWSLKRRATPVDSVQVRRFNIPNVGARDLLEIRREIYYAVVSCFPHGNDLYISWTMWLRMSPARFLWIAIKRMFAQLRFKGHALYTVLESDQAKAFRESLHGAVREGVDVAAGRIAAQGSGTLGTDVAIVTEDATGMAPWMTPTA